MSRETLEAQLRSQAGETVRKARTLLGLNQTKFGETVGKKQSLISKYEKGSIDIPSNIVIHCVNIIQKHEATEITADEIAKLVREKLVGPNFARIRYAIAALINSIEP